MKRVAVALIVLIALLAVWQGLQRHKAASEEQEKAQKDLISASLEQVHRLTIWRRDKKPSTLVFERRDGKWFIVDPIEWRGNDVTLNGLVDQFDERNYATVITADDLRPFGLQPPQFAVTFETADATIEVRVGARAPVGNFRYVALDDDSRVYAVPSGFSYNLEKNLDDYRSRDVFDEFPEHVSAIVAVTEGASLEVTSPDGRQWFLADQRAADDEVQSWINRIKGLRVRSFIQEPDPSWKVRRRLVVRSGDVELELAFADEVPDEQAVRMRLPDGVHWVTISSYSYDGLWKSPADLLPPPPEPETTAVQPETAMTPLSGP